MPPKKRGRRAAAEPSQPEPEPSQEPEPATDDVSEQGDQDRNSDPGSDPDAGTRESEEPDFKFFNTTFSTFRVSPLYTAQNPLTPAGLATLSRRLRDTLVGDVVRGVQVGLEGDVALGRLGALERVEWRACALGAIFPSLAAGAGTDGDEGSEGSETRGYRRGGGVRRGTRANANTEETPRLLCLELEYERATFSALMLPSLDDDDAEEERRRAKGKGKGKSTTGDGSLGPRNPPSWTQANLNINSRSNPHTSPEDEDEDKDTTNTFAHFPLLLTRMPAPLKTTLVDFLSSTFDCRISPLHLGTRTLIHSWERWIEESGVGRGKILNKDVAFTLGFHIEPPAPPPPSLIRPTSDAELIGRGGGGIAGAAGEQETSAQKQQQQQLGLKTIDVMVPADEVRRFLRVGKKNDALDSGIDGGRGQGKGKGVKRPAETARQEGEEERLRRRRLGGGRDEEGWGWREIRGREHTTAARDSDMDVDDRTRAGAARGESDTTFPQPFTNALATYLSHHLALDIYHPGVRVLRVVCDAFALSEGRMKVFAPSSAASREREREGDGGDVAVETFMRDLVRRAQGPGWGAAALRLANLEVAG
ncbi:kinetochore complex Sim4 subunit Fta1-domain-containing protein [Nemania serpens]|nr:kinetochore complex Sim4 subunit Fta1-domain-containing protein [Nemania serpens]